MNLNKGRCFTKKQTGVFILVLLLISFFSLFFMWYVLTDESPGYPQRMWLDSDDNMYVARMLISSIMVYDVRDVDSLQLKTVERDDTFFYLLHDIVVVEDWVYNGVLYEKLVFVVGGESISYMSILSYDNDSVFRFLSVSSLSDFSVANGYLTVVEKDGRLLVCATVISSPGVLFFFDCSDPCHPVLLDVVPVRDLSWVPYFNESGDVVYLTSVMEGNRTIAVYRVVGDRLVYAGVISGEWCPFICFDFMDDVAYVCSADGVLCMFSMVSFDVWSMRGCVDVVSNGEMFLDGSGCFIVLRHYDDGVSDGVVFYHVDKERGCFSLLGYYADVSCSFDTHMQWIDVGRGRGFFLSYGSGSFFSLHLLYVDGVLVVVPGDVVWYVVVWGKF